MSKSPEYTSRILREAGVIKPKRKPYLSQEMAQLQEENAQLRRTKDHLEMEIAILRRDLMELRDMQQRLAQRAER
jgi:hypothetical protein